MDSASWWQSRPRRHPRLGWALLFLAATGCATRPKPPPAPSVAVTVAPEPLPVPLPAPLPPPAQRQGDEIVVAGHWVHTGTRVITWMDPGGYNAYRSKRPPGAPPAYAERHILPDSPRGATTLADLRRTIDQFVLHYDGAGLSAICFNALQARGLSVHFLLDVDGTVYQTLDLREKAEHATVSNSRSIGIEIANLGASLPGSTKRLDLWYRRDAPGKTRFVPPAAAGNPRLHTPGFIARPARPGLVYGLVHGHGLVQYDYTPEQYRALIRLTAALCREFPGIKCDYPHDASGRLIRTKLPDKALAAYQGILGHYHIQDNKIDPGPAFQWDLVIAGARRLLGE